MMFLVGPPVYPIVDRRQPGLEQTYRVFVANSHDHQMLNTVGSNLLFSGGVCRRCLGTHASCGCSARAAIVGC